ncbi:unnamed protein product [Brachionus calyciflorus]|uniref:YTH domain-containing protein n=1 Tax=Brachionus calyciflorus TaxID=104777 RepID=A0A813VE84_9BILA|nr:unnamed protein product [Brachionus calyciflorus]
MNKKNGSKKTERGQDSSNSEFDRQNQLTTESEFTSNTSASTSSSITTSPTTQNNQNQINQDELNSQAIFNDQASMLNQNQGLAQTHIPYINYYPFIQGSNPYNAPIDFNSANWSQTIAMAKSGVADPLSVAAYINAASFSSTDMPSYDQFNFAYPQAFSYSYGNPQISPINEFQQNRNFNKRSNNTNNINSNGANFQQTQVQNYYANNTNNSNNNQKTNKYYNNYQTNKLENDFNSLKLADNKSLTGRNSKNSFKYNSNYQQKYKNQKRYNFNNNFVNNSQQENVMPNENSNLDEMTMNDSNVDSKSWANIVNNNGNQFNINNNNNNNNSNYFSSNQNFNDQFQQNQTNLQNDFSNYILPDNSYRNSNYESRKYNNYTNYNNNNKNIYKNFNSNLNAFGSSNNSNNINNHSSQHKIEFNLDNNAFPPINSNGEQIMSQNKTLKDNSIVTNENHDQFNNNMNNRNYYKRQQYNNYQKQQQKQFGTNVSNIYQNTNDSENEYNNYQISNYKQRNMPRKQQDNDDESYYYKRHQPSQLNISSFMTNLDKKFFMESNDENNKNENQIDIDLKPRKIESNSYNPIEFNITPSSARFFVIKSYSEDDVFVSIKHNVWCSTEHGNRRLNSAFIKGEGNTPVYLFFSVNGSRHFCGMAEMTSTVDFNRKTNLWSQDKWRGCFQVKWIYVKDVPNSLLRNIKLENNDNKPVTNSRDTQEIPFDKGIQVLKVFHTFQHSSSIFDDFDHYENTRHDEETLGNIHSQKIDHKSEPQLIIPLKDDTSSSSISSPGSSDSYNTKPNENNIQQINQFENNGYNQSNLLPVQSSAI